MVNRLVRRQFIPAPVEQVWAYFAAPANLLGPWVAATGREVRDDAAIAARVDRLLDEKYGEIKRQLAAQAAAEGRVYTILEIRFDE